jgi:uridine kinase
MKPYVVGVCGPSCGGKTTITNKIFEFLKNSYDIDIVVLNQDRYYKGAEIKFEKQVKDTNYDIPEALDFEQMVKDLKRLIDGKSIQAPIYNFITHKREDYEPIYSSPIIIVEGILIFNNSDMLKLFDLKVFVSSEKKIRFDRRIKRDTEERGRKKEDVIKRYQEHVEPSNKKYVLPTKWCSDIMIINNSENKFVGIIPLIDHLKIKMAVLTQKDDDY